MGGSSDPNIDHWTEPWCRGCHDRISDGRMTYTKDAQVVTCYDAQGKFLSLRPLVPADAVRRLGDEGEVDFATLAKNLALLSDDALAYFWSQCNRRAAQGYIAQGVVAHIMFDRCGRGDAWYEHAARLLECAPRTVYSRYHAWEYLRTRPDPVTEVESLGWELTAALGHAGADGADMEALAQAVAPLVESAEITRTEATRRVRERKGSEPAVAKCEETGMHVCKYCGAGLGRTGTAAEVLDWLRDEEDA